MRKYLQSTMLFALSLVVTVMLAGCSSPTLLSKGKPVKVDNTISDYQLGAGDQITVNVWRNPELSLTVPVRPDGKISMPLIGDVVAAGKSAGELSNAVSAMLVNYVKNPQVTVIVNNAASSDFQRRVRVTGAVKAPLSIPFRDGMTVLDLVLEAGGPSEFALTNKSILYRKTNGSVKAYAVKLNDILNKGQLDTNYDIQPADIVTVPERNF